MRVALLQLFHEANGFSPLPITLRDFQTRHWCEGDEVRRRFGHTSNWLGGAIAACDEAGVQLDIGLCTACHPGGVVTADTFATIRQSMVDSLHALCEAHRPDVLLLLLHGALLAEGSEMPEGEIAAAMRAIVGPDVVIGVTLDFHANIDPLLASTADLLVAGRSYPHTDAFERGHRLARLAMANRAAQLKTEHVLLPMATALPRQETRSPNSAFSQLVALTQRLEKRHGLADLSLVGGFHFADHDWASMSVLATGASAEARRQAVQGVADAVWELRGPLLAPLPDLVGAAAMLPAPQADGMRLFVDTGDNPGGGGTGETASLLPWLVESGITFAAGFFVDGEAVQDAATAGPGARLSIVLGRHTAQPWQTDAEVLWLGDIRYRNTGPMMTGELLEGGLGAVLRIGRGSVLLTTERIQAYDVNAFRAHGLEPADHAVLLLKSSAHFRASYTPLATGGIVLFDGGGWSSSNLRRYPYTRRMRRILPLAPLDEAGWRAELHRPMRV